MDSTRRERKPSGRVVKLREDYDEAQHAQRQQSAATGLSDMEPLPHPARPGLEEELEQIRSVTMVMGRRVDEAIHKAVEGLIDRDIAKSNEVIRGDSAVNTLQAEARQLCFTAILTQAPVARDLREILGFQHMSGELERMADHCVNIARIARDLADLPPLAEYVDIPKLARHCATQVRDMLSAVVAHDVEQARALAARDTVINRLYYRLVDELVQL
ncbi:MAG TPA: PhoU domain-containing protein, partial [Candidatus Dormibacteraeota bacterium]|nr:PhoU domain-containing protein [Candidatus Dormibacteraeota bacterium]